MRIVVSIYNPPEYYPPTLYAVELLAKKAESLIIVTRNITCKSYSYPPNVEVIRVGESLTMDEAMGQGQVKKIKAFIQFIRKLTAVIKKQRPQVCLGYDSIGLYTLHLARKLGAPAPKVYWYHNHDVQEPGAPVRKYSIGWWAQRAEPTAFNKLQVFSLPSAERLQYFPMSEWTGKYFVAPNYPLRSLYERLGVRNRSDEKEIRLIYQGRISPNHGFEEIIPMLNNIVNGKSIHLTLVGIIADDYKEKLTAIAQSHNTMDKLHIMKPVAYYDLPAITAKHQIGLAIHKPANIIYSTGGTASNKIYEYAATGLPVLLFDNEHYRKYLQDKKWTFFTDCTPRSVLSALQAIDDNYTAYSDAAFHDFRNGLNYENSLQPVITEVCRQVAS